MSAMCLMLILVEGWLSCHGPDIPPPPPVAEMCVSLTSYWVWQDDGAFIAGYEGQCDSSCRDTANGTILNSEWAWSYPDDPLAAAACISSWVFRDNTRTVYLPGYGSAVCIDAFGLESYRQPFYHQGYEQWVVPVDLLAQDVHDLICEGWAVGWTE